MKASLILGFLVILESFGLLYLTLGYLHIALDNPALYTFTFEILFYSAMFLILNVRERRHFWDSKPSRTLLAAMIISLIVGTALVTVGIPGLTPVPLTQTLLILLFSVVFSLGINDLVKFVLVEKAGVRW